MCLILAFGPAAGPMCGCDAVEPASCATFFQVAASHVASTIPLNAQSDCSGYSRVTNTQAVTNTPAICSPDPTDDACMACLRVGCCATVADACLGGEGAADATTCAAVPAVKTCILTALEDPCGPACEGDS